MLWQIHSEHVLKQLCTHPMVRWDMFYGPAGRNASHTRPDDRRRDQGIVNEQLIRQRHFRHFSAEKKTQPEGTWEEKSLSVVCISFTVMTKNT